MRKIFISIFSTMLVLAGCGKAVLGPIGPSVPTGSIMTQAVGVAGGTVNAGVAGVIIPAGALSAETNITVAPLAEGSLPAVVPTGFAFLTAATFGPAGTTFTTPVTISFSLKETAIAGSLLNLMLYDSATGLWGLAASATVAEDMKTATATVTHFSSYALMNASANRGIIHNHLGGTSYSGYFDFSKGREIGFTELNSGDISYKCFNSVTCDITGDDEATGGIIDLGSVELSSVTSVPATGYLGFISFGAPSELLNKCFAVKTKEGTYVVIKIVNYDRQYPDQPRYLVFDWKNIQ